jgi:hypothetical protein
MPNPVRFVKRHAILLPVFGCFSSIQKLHVLPMVPSAVAERIALPSGRDKPVDIAALQFQAKLKNSR